MCDCRYATTPLNLYHQSHILSTAAAIFFQLPISALRHRFATFDSKIIPISLMKEVLSRLRKYEIRIRKAVNAQMRGDYHSVFKGSGLEFDDVRAYQSGDDIRTIDWNVSAKGHGTFVKLFREEKEQTVFFLVDVSASQDIGRQQTKMDLAKDICGVLALSAIKENSQVGLICYSDQKEKYMKPAKGFKHGYELLLNLFQLEPQSIRTDLTKAISFAHKMLKRRSVIIFISDFLDENYESDLKALARKHDLVTILLLDQREINPPKLGIIPIFDRETRRTIWMNTSSSKFQQHCQQDFQERQSKLEKISRQNGANYLTVRTGEDFVPPLIRLFKVRNLRTNTKN